MSETILNTDFETFANAVSKIDGGCGPCITSFLNKLNYNDAKKLAEYINKNNPIYGTRLVYTDGRHPEWEMDY